MALYDTLPVYAETYSLTQLVFKVTQDFPREYKFTLGQDMKRDCLNLLRLIYRINRSQNKVALLEDFLDEFELLKLEIRLCCDMKLMSIKRQADFALMMDSIGRQITGWRNGSQLLHVACVGGFATDSYWSSSENDTNNSWIQNFNNGNQNNKNNTNYVRPVRGL